MAAQQPISNAVSGKTSPLIKLLAWPVLCILIFIVLYVGFFIWGVIGIPATLIIALIFLLSSGAHAWATGGKSLVSHLPGFRGASRAWAAGMAIAYFGSLS